MKLTYSLLLVLLSFCCWSSEDNKSVRFVTLAPHFVEMLFAINAQDTIVATIEYSNHPEAAKKIPRIGNHRGVDIEKILTYQPDYVIFWEGGNQLSDRTKLEELGIQVVSFKSKNIEDIANTLVVLGELSNRQTESQLIADKFLQELQTLRSLYANKPKVELFYTLWHEPLMTVNANSWINDLINVCNAHNVFADAQTTSVQISLEHLIVAEPDIIVIPDTHQDEQQKLRHKLLPLLAQWTQIPAVKNNKFVYVDGDSMHRFSPNLLGGLSHMCKQIDKLRETN